MSNFTCEHCHTDILEGEDGRYITGCFHYPIQQFQTGSITITDIGDGFIWLESEGGEGGQFDKVKFAEAVSKFYSDNF